MTIYHVETQENYNALMVELEEKGRKWLGGAKPTQLDKFKSYGKDTYIFDESGVLSFSSGYYFIAYCSNETLIEYKAKGENMAEEEKKQNIIDWARDVSVAVESFSRDMYEAEADLQEAKSSAKKLIEKIDEYLESRKPEFKVGDYATVEVNGRKIIAKIDELTENKTAFGLWYDEPKNIVKQDFWFLTEGNIFSHSTPEEIAEYEVALTFHKHGRKPFEVKEDDLLEYPNGHNIMIYYPEVFSKAHFLNDGFKLIKTAEEVNEWLENK